MVVCESNINNIIGGIENTGGVTLHNHRRKLKQRFDIIKKLGQGTYGKVQLGINKETGQEVAIKTIKKCKIETEADLVRIRREIQIMSSVQHPNIIHIYEVFENREKMVLVMEYAAGGELYDYLSERKVLNEEEARRIFRQIVTAVYYCHKHKICHRDLKLENILLDEHGSAKIADFGLSNVFDDRRLLSTFCGSPLYASPEIVKGTPYHGPEVDCWSLGVLLYTLVYGAMPFDGSNFKRLVKQISHGDYFEPKNASPASPLIRHMLTVSPEERSNIEQICAHWWVNVGYKDSCLEVAEELANQTPVRLDLLLSLAPPPPVGSDKLVVTDEASIVNVPVVEATPIPARSQSVGSLMELAPSAERRIRDLQATPKRKLEVTVSTEHANQSSTGAKRKERPVKKEKDYITEVPPPPVEPDVEQIKQPDETRTNEEKTIAEHPTETVKEMEVDPIEANNVISDKVPEIEGAACKELLEELSKIENKQEEKQADEKREKPSEKNILKESNKITTAVKTDAEKPPEKEKKKVIKKIVKKKVPSEKKIVENNIENKKPSEAKLTTMDVIESKKEEDVKKLSADKKEEPKKEEETKKVEEINKVEEDKKVEETTVPKSAENAEETKNGTATPPIKPIERRRSKIFETAEKLQNMAKGNDVAPKAIEKPKKIFIPGVNVGGFKKEFERKASLTSAAPLLKTTNSVKNIPTVPTSSVPTPAPTTTTAPTIPSTAPTPTQNGTETNLPEPVVVPKTNDVIQTPVEPPPAPKSIIPPKQISPPVENKVPETKPEDAEQKLRKQNAINIISSAITKEGTRKSKSRPSVLRKTPVPFGASGRSASGNITTLPLSPTELVSNITSTISEESLDSTGVSRTPSDISKKSTAEITLKSATLPPQRKTAKAEIKLNYPPPRPVTMEFKTEVSHRIEAPQEYEPYPERASPVGMKYRSSSCDPEFKSRDSPKERIIPISFEKEEGKPETPSLQSKPPMPKPSHSMRSLHRHGSISRQSTQDSDSEATISETLEPIKKSPKEYIIPIAVEGGGYVTPRATSTEPSESSSGVSSLGRQSVFKFGRTKRMSSLLNDDDESQASTLHRHNSMSRDSDNEDSRKEPFHMHRLRSSRPTRKVSLEHADSLSSAEEDDDDDGFEILTAENLFSTLLSRVRNLTQRLNVEDNGRLGFPSSRLLGDFDRGTKMFMNDPLSRYSLLDQTFNRERRNARSPSAGAGTPWRRSVSRDLANDIEKVFNNTPTASATLPRGKSKERSELNLSNEDSMALSYLTPGLSRRIRKHLLSSQIPSTHSSRSSSRNQDKNITEETEISANQESASPEKPSNSFKSKLINRFNRSISHDRGTSSRYSKTDKSDLGQTEDLFPEKSDLYYRSKDNEGKNSGEKSNLNDIISLTTNSLYNSRMPVRSVSPIISNSSKKYTPSYSDVGSKVSRFLRSSFHDDYSRKCKEKEAQKVLREIRKKRDSKEEKTKDEHINEKTEPKTIEEDKKTHDEIITKPETSVAEKSEIEKPKIEKKSRISKLLRPKSYPTDYLNQNNDYTFDKNASLCNGSQKSSEESVKSKEQKTSPPKQIVPPKTRIGSFTKAKPDKKSKVETTIRSLRERSLPHNTDYCATESNLIKRAVSLEDFSILTPPVSFKDKALQTSRKSVSKILGLFEKYENQSKNKQKTKKVAKNEENGKDDKKNGNSKNYGKAVTKDSAKKKVTENEVLSENNSKIPVGGKKIEAPSKIPIEKQLTPLEAIKLQDELNKRERKSERDKIPKLRLDLKEQEYKKEDTHNFISPSDETTESVCSDSLYHDSSPNSLNKIFSDDEECESVSERIHRKSFYSRFNEKKKRKKSSSVGAYDIKDYLARFDEPVSESSNRKIKSYDRSASNKTFNSGYSSLRPPTNYSRQSSLPTGTESGLYAYNSYNENYRSSKKSPSPIASYLPGSSKSSLSESKDTLGKTTKLTSQNQQPVAKFEKSSEVNQNDISETSSLSQGSSSISRSTYLTQN